MKLKNHFICISENVYACVDTSKYAMHGSMKFTYNPY